MVVWPVTEGATCGVLAARYAAAIGRVEQHADAFSSRVVDSAGRGGRCRATRRRRGLQAQGQGATVFSSGYWASSGTWSASQPLGAAMPLHRATWARDRRCGTVTAVWLVDPASGQTLMAAARRVSGQPWAAPVTLAARRPARRFAVASRAGDVTVLWCRPPEHALVPDRSGSGVGAYRAHGDNVNYIWNWEAQSRRAAHLSWSAPQIGLPVTGYRLRSGHVLSALSDLADLDMGVMTRLVTTVPRLRRVVPARPRRSAERALARPRKKTGSVSMALCGRDGAERAHRHGVGQHRDA